MGRLQVRRQHAVAGAGDGGHHPVRADRDQAVGIGEPDRGLAHPAERPGRHGLDDVPHEQAVLGPAGRDRLAAVHRENQDIGGGLELLPLVEVLGLLVAREIDHAVAELTGLLSDREEDGVSEPAAAEDDRPVLGQLGRAPRRPHDQHGLPGL